MILNIKDVFKIAKKVYDRTLLPGQYIKPNEVNNIELETFDEDIHNKVDVKVTIVP